MAVSSPGLPRGRPGGYFEYSDPKQFWQYSQEHSKRQIDRLVYALHGLTDEEIRVVVGRVPETLAM